METKHRCERVALSIIAGMLVPFLFWAGGFNFERGEGGFNCALLTIAVTIVVYYLEEPL